MINQIDEFWLPDEAAAQGAAVLLAHEQVLHAGSGWWLAERVAQENPA